MWHHFKGQNLNAIHETFDTIQSRINENLSLKQILMRVLGVLVWFFFINILLMPVNSFIGGFFGIRTEPNIQFIFVFLTFAGCLLLIIYLLIPQSQAYILKHLDDTFRFPQIIDQFLVYSFGLSLSYLTIDLIYQGSYYLLYHTIFYSAGHLLTRMTTMLVFLCIWLVLFGSIRAYFFIKLKK